MNWRFLAKIWWISLESIWILKNTSRWNSWIKRGILITEEKTYKDLKFEIDFDLKMHKFSLSENKTIAIFNMSIKNLEKNANEDLKNEWNQEIQNENDLVINLNSEENIRNSRNSEQEIREDPKSLITEDRKNLDLDAKGGSQRIQILTWNRL